MCLNWSWIYELYTSRRKGRTEKKLVEADKILKYVSQNLNICDNKFPTLLLYVLFIVLQSAPAILCGSVSSVSLVLSVLVMSICINQQSWNMSTEPPPSSLTFHRKSHAQVHIDTIRSVDCTNGKCHQDGKCYNQHWFSRVGYTEGGGSGGESD